MKVNKKGNLGIIIIILLVIFGIGYYLVYTGFFYKFISEDNLIKIKVEEMDDFDSMYQNCGTVEAIGREKGYNAKKSVCEAICNKRELGYIKYNCNEINKLFCYCKEVEISDK